MDITIIIYLLVMYAGLLFISLLYIIGVVAFYKKKKKPIQLSTLIGMFYSIVLPNAIYYSIGGTLVSNLFCFIAVLVVLGIAIITIPISYLLTKYLSHLYLTSSIGPNNYLRKTVIAISAVLCLSYIILSVPGIGTETFTVRLIDQHGKPVSNASLTFRGDQSCMPRLPVFGAPKSGGIVKTNNQGLVTIKPFGNKFLILDISKTGHIHKGGSSFFTKYKSDSGISWDAGPRNQPYIINLWKIEETAALIVGEKKYYWWLKDGSQVIQLPAINSDITVSIKAEGTRSNPMKWSATLKSRVGGFIESNDTFMYEAPTAGYQRQWQVEFVRGKRDWSSRANRKFYYNAGQVYGSLNVKFRPFFNTNEKAAVFVNYLINPTGTNLVYDREKEIHLPQ